MIMSADTIICIMMWGNKMVTIANGEWIADLGDMTCRNINTKMVVVFEKQGKAFLGKIRDMPIEIMEQWAKLEHGERLVQKAVTDAEDVFLRAYFESDIERNGVKKFV
jgi:hypothetical protein